MTSPHTFLISLIYTPLTSKFTQEIVHSYGTEFLISHEIGPLLEEIDKNECLKDGIVYIDDFFGNFMAGKLMANLPSETLQDVEVLFIRLIKLGGYTGKDLFSAPISWLG